MAATLSTANEVMDAQFSAWKYAGPSTNDIPTLAKKDKKVTDEASAKILLLIWGEEDWF